MTPSQSSSRLLQVSATAPSMGLQTWTVPPEQLSTVCSQTPTPQVVVPKPSSSRPSQSLSMPSQSSVWGTMAPEQPPQAPAAQKRVPAWQAPAQV